ncbi:coiled-coil domain-containing protein 50 isoform X1 [Pteropus vampyrus]|uniref:Coiled-coil domain-containing protein 50 isoform X1 n=2 Tax=Pteropus TaxID=9401 RepID=A0A6P3RDU4_PTEVA|nr:coiled-coil domain-containing protein 50 isoform X1 [Pteropus vampyrus]
MTLRWERQGPGAGAKRGPSHRRVTQHKGDSREAAAGADLRSPATRNCGYRPAAPLLLPTQARPPARLSVSSLPPYWTARVRFQAPDIWYRSGLGAREQVAAAGQLGRQLGAPGQSPVAFVTSFCPAARSLLRARARCRPDFAPRRALLLLLLLRAGRLRCRRQPGSRREGRPGPWPNMAEVSIDQSKLPGVKEVCRDFAVLEDHTLAHSLQEQEIEHHLASNVQRNRLVQHDLQVAKQLQEEDLKAQAQLQKRYKDLEQQDCEIAQEIQEKLAIEAERRRIQEKKDEDIARILQEKELQEEKKRKKHFPDSSRANAYGESCYYEDGGIKPRAMKEAVSTPSRVSHRDQEWYDAEIARKLQEEEILATQVDVRAAQVAQDEEIARLLMAEEKKAYKKAKEREKSSLDKRKHDHDWKPKTSKLAHSKSKESEETHRSKNDRPARPPPPTMTDAEDLDYTLTNQHNSTRHFPKSESSYKGFHYKQ